MTNPYKSFDERAFWRPAVGNINALEISDLWRPRFEISKDEKVVTAGSCFAQHIGKALVKNGFHWFDAEPGPFPVSEKEAQILKSSGYGVFSFRTGNIYTASLLKQWLSWALDPEIQSQEVWEKDGCFFDPQRPAIEPGGFTSAAEVLEMRMVTLKAIRRAFSEAGTLVFTMGLTEGWENAESGVSYAMCPGTIAGDFDPNIHIFKNYSHAKILSDMNKVIEMAREINPNLKILLTVSPVPLTATASDEHVLVATTQSKSTLRSVAHELQNSLPEVDYFPSYEVISSPPFRGMFYKPNQREVSLKGVDVVMSHFFAGLGFAEDPQDIARSPSSSSKAMTLKMQPASSSEDDVQCEEAVLQAFE